MNTTSTTSGAEIAYPYGAPEFTPDFSGVPVPQSLVLCVCFVDICLSFVLLAIVLSVLRFTDSDYPLGIFKLFFKYENLGKRQHRYPHNTHTTKP